MIRCEKEEKSIASHIDVSYDSTENYNKLGAHRYVLDRRIDTEIVVQNKGIDIFKNRGINPDIEENYYENSDK